MGGGKEFYGHSVLENYDAFERELNFMYSLRFAEELTRERIIYLLMHDPK